MTDPIVYLNYNAMAFDTPELNLSPAHRAASRFFQCGIVDRTLHLHDADGVRVLDPLTAVLDGPRQPATFAELSDARGRELVALAKREGKTIDVLWSGGIDSTVALIAILRACSGDEARTLVRVGLSLESIREHARFYRDVILERELTTFAVASPLTDFLNTDNLLVTGEHGDQLFGSHHAQDFVELGIADRPWREAFELLAAERLTDPTERELLRQSFEQVLASCPVPVTTTFDFMWWLNMTLKWQSVALRISVSGGERAAAIDAATHHFFRTTAFQQWSIFDRDRTVPATWSDYKSVAKDYIFDFHADTSYRRDKVKVPSLCQVFDGEPKNKKQQFSGDPAGPRAVVMRGNFRPEVRYLGRVAQ